MSTATEFSLDTTNGRMAGLSWRNDGAPRVLCLHGWLDNAASFLPLAPHLPSLDLVALDFAGHGHSSHRPAGARYYFMEYLWDVDAALNALGWDDCHLIGHSLGGAVACAFTAAAPERVRKLVALDGLGPLSAPANTTAQRLRQSLRSVRKTNGAGRRFASVEEAASARTKASGLPLVAAMLICERSLVQEGGHFRWRSDPGLKWDSPLRLTDEQALDILAAIEVPTLSFTAVPHAPWITAEQIRDRLTTVTNCVNHEIQGHHHFHMDQAGKIAPLILEFLTATETSDDYRKD